MMNMEQRVRIADSQPQAWKAMYHLSGSLGQSRLSPIQRELIKMRASQINGCAFCLDMHSREALQIGETAQRLFVLPAWRETDLFTPEEKAILAITEEVTLIHQHGLSDETYRLAASFFPDETIAEIIMATVIINAWNRISISTQLPVPEVVAAAASSN